METNSRYAFTGYNCDPGTGEIGMYRVLSLNWIVFDHVTVTSKMLSLQMIFDCDTCLDISILVDDTGNTFDFLNSETNMNNIVAHMQP